MHQGRVFQYKSGRLQICQGGSSLALPHVLGIDAAGIIDAVGPEVSAWKAGDRVIALDNLLRWGGFAEYVVVSQDIVSAIPANLAFEAAATIPCAGITVRQAVYRKVHPGGRPIGMLADAGR